MTTMPTSLLVPFTREEIEQFKQKRKSPSKELVIDYVIELKKWLAQQHHLPKLDDELLGKYLFGCKYNVEETKKRINNFYVFRSRHANLFGDRDPCSSENRAYQHTVHHGVMPKATREGYRIHFAILADTDPEFYSPVNLFRRDQAITDLILRDEKEVCTPGLIFVVSGMDTTITHMIKWELSLLKAISDIITKTRPESIKGIHFIDCTNIIKPVVLLLINFLSSKLKKRISYNEPEVLYKQVPKDMLPDEFGGTAGPAAQYSDASIEYVEQNRDWLMTEGTLKADLDLMPKENEYAVFTDTFRKLEVD